MATTSPPLTPTLTPASPPCPPTLPAGYKYVLPAWWGGLPNFPRPGQSLTLAEHDIATGGQGPYHLSSIGHGLTTM